MKRAFKVAGFGFLAILLVLYSIFLFVLPRTIDLEKYKPDVQKFVKDNTGLTLDYNNVKFVTSPLLEAGIQTNDITLKLPDNSVLFSADKFKGKIFLPELLWSGVRVTCAEVSSPKANIEIINGEKYKVAKIYEDLVNKKRQQKRLKPPEELADITSELPFDLSSYNIIIPALKLKDYNFTINDIKANHKLTLKGKQFDFGYFNGDTVKVKTISELLSDDKTNITANVDITTFVPDMSYMLPLDDDEGVLELPFVNPVTEFRNYDLKSDINSKIQIKKDKKLNKIWAKGYFNIDNTSVSLAGLQLPNSYFNLQADGFVANIDTIFYVTDKEYMKFLGKINYGKNPSIDCSLKSTQIHFDNLLKITKAYLDTAHIKNNIGNMSASGYLYSNFHFKTDFETLISDGKFIIRDGNVYDKNIGLLLNDMVANITFDDNNLNVEKTHMLVNKKSLDISGNIDSNSNSILNVTADRIPLMGLYKAFAPYDIKKTYNLASGFLSVDAKLMGTIKNTSSILKTSLDNLIISDTKGIYTIRNNNSRFNIANSSGVIRGKFQNEGFKIDLPKTKSVISNSSIIANLDNRNINIKNSDFLLNNKSKITFNGIVKNYLSSPDAKLFAKGNFDTNDIKILLGSELAPYMNAKGAIPVKMSFNSKDDDMTFRLQMQASANAFITPVNFKELAGKNVLLQILVEKDGNTARIYKSGLYARKPNAVFSDNLPMNLIGIKEIVGLRAIFTNLNTDPFISLFKVTVPKELNGSFCIFPKSKFLFGGNAYVLGHFENPKITGKLNLRMLDIPELYTKVRDITIDIASRDIKIFMNDILANGSDFSIKAKTTWKLLPEKRISGVKVVSRFINVDKLVKISENYNKIVSSRGVKTISFNKQIPFKVLGGNVNLRKIQTRNIFINNTTGRVSLYNNVLYLNNLKTYPLNGKVTGNASLNLLSKEFNLKANGKGFDINKILVDVLDMKDILSGNVSFTADISMKGVTFEDQMKSLKGYVDFDVKDGQLGPFGRFENFIMAENVRNNTFFSAAMAPVIAEVVSIDTSKFNNLSGHLTFKDGIADVSPIKTQGNVMSMFVEGDFSLIDKSADLVLKGRLAPDFSDKLGYLSIINPVNIVDNASELNIIAAKNFANYTQIATEEDIDSIPSLIDDKSDRYSPKFQVLLHGDMRKPLKMIRTFQWLAIESDIENAQKYVDLMPTPEVGEEHLSVDELIKKREEQAANQQVKEEATPADVESQDIESDKDKTFGNKFKKIFKKENPEK